MTSANAGTILRQLRTLVDAEAARGMTDAQLLQRFAVHREQAAFTALMSRHGARVWDVCRRLLPQEQDAEDAFQATFLVLAQRADAIDKTEAVGSFLYGVANRVATKARQATRRRRNLERQAMDRQPAQPSDDLSRRELQAVLDEEVQHLPVSYRTPFVLCCLHGKSRLEAARELDCKEGTISSRLARARQLLQRRLTRRGVALSAALAVGELEAAVPALLASRTLAAVTGAGGAAASVRMLAEGAMVLGFTKWQTSGALLLGLCLLAAGAGALILPAAAPPPETTAKADPVVRKDRHGDPLPAGALARFGTVRQRAPQSHLAVTADGKEVVAVGRDLTVRRFDARTGELRTVRQLPGKTANKTWLSPRGTFLLAQGWTPSTGLQLELWDLASGKVHRTLPIPERSVGAAAFSADERRVGVADSFASFPGEDHRVLAWDLDASKSRVLWSLREDFRRKYIQTVALSPDGKRLVACHLDRIMRCWDFESGKLLWQAGPRYWAPFIFFHPDGRTLIAPTGIGTGGLEIRDAATGKMRIDDTLPKEAEYAIGFSPNGRFLAFQTGQEGVVLWEPEKKKIVFRFPRPPHRRASDKFKPNRLPSNFAFTPDGTGFIRRAGALQRWELAAGKPTYSDTERWGHTEEVTKLLFSPNGRLLASSSGDQTARLWEIATRRTMHVIPKLGDYLAFTPDGKGVLTVPASIYDQAVLHATNVTTGREERCYELTDRREFMTGSDEKGLRVTADGKKILMLSWKNGRVNDESILSEWEAATGKCLVHKRVPWGEESLLTPDGRSVLMFDSRTGEVRLLAIDTGARRWQLKADRTPDARQWGWSGSLAMSADGRLMASRMQFQDRRTNRMEQAAIRIGDMATGRQLLKLSLDGPTTFDFSADSRLLAVAGRDSVRFWEMASGKEIGSILVPNETAGPRDRACVRSLAFSPDGRVMATGHADGSILLWDATRLRTKRLRD